MNCKTAALARDEPWRIGFIGRPDPTKTPCSGPVFGGRETRGFEGAYEWRGRSLNRWRGLGGCRGGGQRVERGRGWYMNELTGRYRSSVLPNNFQLSSINRTRDAGAYIDILYMPFRSIATSTDRYRSDWLISIVEARWSTMTFKGFQIWYLDSDRLYTWDFVGLK